MEHKTTLNGGLDQLAEDIGDLRYDALQTLLTEISLKLRHDAAEDRTKKRIRLSDTLEKAADKLLESAAAISVAWMISKPHMELKDGS